VPSVSSLSVVVLQSVIPVLWHVQCCQLACCPVAMTVNLSELSLRLLACIGSLHRQTWTPDSFAKRHKYSRVQTNTCHAWQHMLPCTVMVT
jgi:hypothetical protein